MDGITLNRQQSRSVDSIAIGEYGIPGMVLMENAGRGVVDLLLGWDPSLAGDDTKSVAILCGKGNNAGDGFVIARHLEIHGVRCRVVLLCSPDELSGDAEQNFEILQKTNVRITDLSQSSELELDLDAQAADATWLVDAMLGTGAQGEPREPIATSIRWMNAQRAKRLAVDVPSGLDCDTGKASTSCVRADHTCTFVAAKRGFLEPSAVEYVGQLHVVSIGVPPRLVMEVASGG